MKKLLLSCWFNNFFRKGYQKTFSLCLFVLLTTIFSLTDFQLAFAQNAKEENSSALSTGEAKSRIGKQTWVNDPFNQKVFIENKGQLDDKTGVEGVNKIKYAIINMETEYYFTPSGWTYRHEIRRAQTEEDIKSLYKTEAPKDEKEERERKEGVTIIPTYVNMNWVGANPDAKIIASDSVSDYYNYVQLDAKPAKTITARACRKITYIDLYPGIDVEYFFPDGKPGIEYSLILHPGADISVVKMSYSDDVADISIDNNGNVQIKTSFGDFIDHAPSTHYADGSYIKSAFQLTDNTVSFITHALKKSKYKNQDLIIDPWTVNPGNGATGFTGYDAGYDIGYDSVGDVYAYGGEPYFTLIKYNNIGTKLWSTSINFFDLGCGPGGYYGCYGDFAVDASSQSVYMVEGFHDIDDDCYGYEPADARVAKLNSAGTLIAVWDPNLACESGFCCEFGYDAEISEMWRIVFNNCTKQAIIAGGGISQTYQACILDTTLTSLNPVNVLSTDAPYHDFTLLAIDNYSNCFMATNQKYGDPGDIDNQLLECPSTSLLPVSYMVSDNYSFIETSSIPYVDNVTSCANGFNGIAVNATYLYTYNGTIVEQWDKNTGTLLNSRSLGGTQFKSGGIDINDCDTIYIGFGTSILKLEPTNLTTVSTVQTFSGNVYALKLAPGNLLYATGKNFVASISLPVTCGNLNLTPADTPDSCHASGTGTASVTATGGVGPFSYSWSPSGKTTQMITGLSSGTYSVTVTDLAYSPCATSTGGTQTLAITIPSTGITATAAPDTSICPNNAVNLYATPSSGDTYIWAPSSSLSNPTLADPVATPSVTTTYTVTVTTPSGCTSTATAIVSVSAVPPAPTVTKSVTGDTLFASTNASYTGYQWYKDSVIMPGKTSDTLVIGSDPSYFSVVVTGTDGCTNQGVFDNRDLPIELINFDAIYDPATAAVDLYWSTASEINNNFFTVEKTKDDVNFITVAKVKGAGTSYSLLNYYAVDDNPYIGISYYRLKQTDFNGKFEYSSLVPVMVRSSSHLQIIALSNSNEQNSIQYFVSSPAGTPFTIVITDLVGKIMFTETSTGNIGSINFSTFAHGIYFFKIYNGCGSSVKKFVY